MSFFASVLRAAYKLSGAKKAFTLPEDEILKVIEKQNRSRGVFTPKDHEAHYEMITVNGLSVPYRARKAAAVQARHTVLLRRRDGHRPGQRRPAGDAQARL